MKAVIHIVDDSTFSEHWSGPEGFKGLTEQQLKLIENTRTGNILLNTLTLEVTIRPWEAESKFLFGEGRVQIRHHPTRIMVYDGFCITPPVALAHELIHALHFQLKHFQPGMTTEQKLQEEHRTIGIEGFEKEQITENQFRADIGIAARTRYIPGEGNKLF